MAKILLIKDVHKLGRSGDVVSVKNGYARNYLIPYGFAHTATKETLRLQKKLREERERQAIIDRENSSKISNRIQDMVYEISVKVDTEGHLYGSVAAQQIAEWLSGQLDSEIKKSDVDLKHPIKKLGEHVVSIKLPEGVVASLNVQVSAESKEANEE